MYKLESGPPPRFTRRRAGKPDQVTLETTTYLALLVRANVTDPAFWPPGFQAGATALARVRQIEAEYGYKEGEFDWEKLPSDIQDEYDALCVSLDQWLEPNDAVNWEKYAARRQGSQR